MSEIKALEKLRAAGRNMAKGRNLENHEECNLLLVIADEIQAEIDERFMALPLDADGMPIHVGDEMTCHGDVFKACAVAPAKIHRWVTVKFGETQTTYSYDPAKCMHYKPRKLEDIVKEIMEYGHIAVEDFDHSEKVNEFSNEIRELMEED